MVKKNKPQKKSSGMKWIIGIVVIIAVIVAIVFISKKGSKYSQEALVPFAKCLTEKGTVMYGAFWCPHCARTKARFGESFRYINYIECDPRGDNEQSELCISKKIDKYDTWEFASGERVIPEPSFEVLAEKSGCPAPEAKG